MRESHRRIFSADIFCKFTFVKLLKKAWCVHFTVHPCVNCAVKFEPHMKKVKIVDKKRRRLMMQVW